jgi:hypothetical protein
MRQVWHGGEGGNEQFLVAQTETPLTVSIALFQLHHRFFFCLLPF